MTTSTIAREIHGFLRDQILSGQDDGLTESTPLLELGILDSFSLFKLLAHLNEAYRVDLKTEQIAGRDFRNIESIARLIEQRLPSRSPDSPPSSPAQPEGVAVFGAPDCAQLFVMFTGLGGVGMPGRVFAGAAGELVEDTATFFRRAGLHDRNLILFHDARGHSYKNGVSPELPDREGIYAWLRDWIGRHRTIDEVYCIGVSAGGPMAMLAGRALGAHTVWALAPRTARGRISRDVQDDLGRLLQQVIGKTIGELHEGITPEDEARIDKAVTPKMVDAYYRSLLDPDQLLDREDLASVVGTLSQGNGVTSYRVLYVPRDRCDALVAATLRGCPGVSLVPLEPSDAPPPVWAFSRWVAPERWVCRDHLVVDLLRERGTFAELFPPFRGVSLAVSPA